MVIGRACFPVITLSFLDVAVPCAGIQDPLPRRRHTSRGRQRRSRPAAPTRPPAFEAGPATLAGSLSRAEDGVLETHPHGATRFPGGDRALAASSSTAESGRLERHGHSRALVSSQARHPGRFALPGAWAGQANRPVRADRCSRDLPASLCAAPEIRTRNLFLLREAPLPVWARTA